MTDPAGQERAPVSDETAARPTSALILLIACAALAFAGFLALGTWQLYRLQWKLALIERVEQRVHAAPVPAPGPERWTGISAASDEYRRVQATGTFLYKETTRVQAVSMLGSGYWLLTPLRGADGNIMLVNRGFVPSGSPEQTLSDSNRTLTVTGLLRLTEPGGGFLRDNDPAGKRWYSRDVQAIAAAHRLSKVAPFFIDADGPSANAASPADEAVHPVGGLTVISFHNNHLGYALTWYALALLMAGAAVWIVRTERKRLRTEGIEKRHDAGKQE